MEPQTASRAADPSSAEPGSATGRPAAAPPAAGRYSAFDLTLAGVCILLCALAAPLLVGGGASSGLIACVQAGLVLFGLYLAALGWWPARGLAALVKVIAFACVWLLQAAMLGAEVGGDGRPLLDASGLALAVWVAVFLLSLPSVGGALLLSLNRLTASPVAGE